jgi:hypothetical protein
MMNRGRILVALAVIAAGVIVFLWHEALGLRKENERMSAEVAALNERLAGTAREVDSLRAQTPGLGEYMSTIQLHAAKLWFAAFNGNWPLARYELDELSETMESAEGLHAVKNKVDVSSVLQGVRQTQLAQIALSIRNRDLRAFKSAYGETLAACNGCHRPAGFEFIHIILPAQPPVTNQEWKASAVLPPVNSQP